jgi:clan AA aspartic protease (TIGR02281 family)
MDNGIIQCPRCDTDNPVESDICYVCGEPLHEVQPEKTRRHWLIGLFILIGIGIGAGAVSLYYQHAPDAPQKTASETVSAVSSTQQKEKIDLASKPASLPSKKPAPKQPSTLQNFTLAKGLVIIKDVAEKVIAQFTTPIVAGRWVAVPKQLCIGGFQWMLRLDSGIELRIVDGIIGENDQIGLWRIQIDAPIDGPSLSSWKPEKAVVWVSLKSDATSQPAKIQLLDKQAHFAKATLDVDGNINEPGVLLQDGTIVGWTFGSIADGAYLWLGDVGAKLNAEIRVDDFYRTAFADSREEVLTLALALGDEYTQLERLAATANAFRYVPKLSADNTPVHLQPDAVISTLRTQISRLVQDGFAPEVANVFDAQILIQAADIDLVNDVIGAAVEGYGFEEAAELAEDVAGRIKLTKRDDKTQLIVLRSGLYQDWIAGALEQGDIQGGLHAHELGSQSLPADLKIHLLGVRLALAENDWAKAERLLAAKEYPSALGDQVANLKAQISELKGLQGKIVIRFTPGTRLIQVTATLDQSVQQQFIVDTGASTVTIPSATAERLGLQIDSGNPLRIVNTAAGVIEAPEVVLPSIKVDDWEVVDVSALVIDIPNQSNLGLLGLNFLNRFRMDLNTEKGILILEPR